MRWLFWMHRWLGIATCLLCAMWLVSGLVMLYVPYPSWHDDERAAFLLPLDTAQLRLSPGEALTAADLDRAPTHFRLEMFGYEPVYRIADFGKFFSISAVDGRAITHVDAEEARRRLEASSDHKLAYLGTIASDLWSVTGRFAPHRPLHLFEAADGDGTRYYVSSRTGEIVQSATRRERYWNWIGAVPHWLYIAGLRENAELWRSVVMWTAGLASVGAALGLWIGILRVRVKPRYGGRRFTPYRGIMKVHHVAGLAGGLLLTAWLASGWLSVSPFGLFSSMPITPDQLARYYAAGAPTFDMSASVMTRRIGAHTKEVQFTWVGGDALFVVKGDTSQSAFRAYDGEPIQLGVDDIVRAAKTVYSDRDVQDVIRLDNYDAYWYAHRSERPLPALRIVFDDAERTWMMVDPSTGRMVGVSDLSERWRRWLFNFFHIYDHPALLQRPLLREGFIWIFSLIGVLVSLTGAVVGVRSLRRSW